MHHDFQDRRSAGDGADGSGAERPGHHLDWPVRAGAVADVLREMDRRVAARRYRRRGYMAAAAVVGTLAAGFFLSPKAFSPHETKREPAPAPSAIVSYPDRHVLPDGSVVELKPGARIEPAFTPALRRVTLESGEAHFQVAKDPTWPFVVVAGGVEFRAVGTAFSVQLGNEAVELLVTEGRVAVDQPVDASAPPAGVVAAKGLGAAANPGLPAKSAQTLALVGAGNRLVVSRRVEDNPVAPAIEAVTATELGARLAWRVPRLEFSGTPLSDAIPLFNRHNRVRLVLGDAELARVQLSGILRADNVDTLLALLQDSYGIRAEKRGESEILLRRAR